MAFSITPETTSVNENSPGFIDFTVSRSPSSGTETVYFSTILNGGSNSNDYTTIVDRQLVFSPGVSSQQVRVFITPDNEVEPDQTFGVIIQQTPNPSASVFLDRSFFTIRNDDSPPPTFSISNAGNVIEGNNAVFTVTRSGSISSPVTVWYSTTPGSASAANGDYPDIYVNQQLTFNPSGSATQQILIPTLVESGNPSEPDQTFNVVLMNGPSGSILSTGTATILANGSTAPPATFSISNAGNVTEGNNAVFTVTRSGSISSPVTVWYSTTPGSASAANGDYPDIFVNQQLTFNPGGSATQQILIPTLVEPGNPSEPDQNFNVVLMNGPSGSILSTGTATILSNGGTTPPPTFSISNAGTVTEGNNAVFTVTRSGSITSPVTVWYSTTPGSASAANGDYPDIYVNQQLTFSPGGSATQQILIPTLVEPGNPSEPDQNFNVVLMNGPSGSILSTGTATILANGAPAVPDDYADEATDATAPIGIVSVGGSQTGFVGPADTNDTFGDKDLLRVSLIAGQTYEFRMQSTSINGQSLPLGIFTIRDPNDFNNVLSTSGAGGNVSATISADLTGSYYVRVGTGGSATDTGGYRISVTNTTQTQVLDDFADLPGDTSSQNGIGNIAIGGSRSGILETVGDKDVFKGSFVAGHTYQVAVSGERVSGSSAALQNVYMSLRAGNDFNHVVAEGGNTSQASFSFLAQQNGDQYIRIGAGGNGSSTGGYRVSVFDNGVVAPPAEPNPTTPPVSAAKQWLDLRFSELGRLVFSNLFNHETWDLFKDIARKLNDAEAAQLADYISKGLKAFSLGFDLGTIISDVAQARDKVQTLIVDLVDYAAGWAVEKVGAGLGGIIGGSISGPLAFITGTLGKIIGGIGGKWFYENYLESRVEQSVDLWWDGVDDPEWGGSSASVNALELNGSVGAFEIAAADANSESEFLEEAKLIRFDESYYLSAYPDAAAAIANGSVGSAYAHFLAIGIDKGYRPNDSQLIARADLALSALNYDPLALNRVIGDGFSNRLFGSAGNDTIDGGPGIDTAVFSGPRSAYTLTRIGNTLQVSGPDGIDTLTRVEKLAFDDGTIPSGLSVLPHDFGADGRSDILLQNVKTGSAYIWQMNGTGLVGNGPVGWTPGAAWQAKDGGDYNGDGSADILLQNVNTGDCYIWALNGTSLVGTGGVGWTPGAHWQAKATGDFNGDGKSDIVLQNASTGDAYMWMMNGTSLAGHGPAGWTPGADWHII